MNYNSKRLINPLKPICKCKAAEFNTLIDVVRGSTSTKEHNKNFAFKKVMEELTSPCTDKDRLTLAEIVKVIPYMANTGANISCNAFVAETGVYHKGFFILVSNDNSVKYIESIYNIDERYHRNSSIKPELTQDIDNIHFPLTDRDITLIKKALTFTGIAYDYTSNPFFKHTKYSGTIYMYKLNGTD